MKTATRKTSESSKASASFSVPLNARYDHSALLPCTYGIHTVICETSLQMGTLSGKTFCTFIRKEFQEKFTFNEIRNLTFEQVHMRITPIFMEQLLCSLRKSVIAQNAC